MFLPHIRPTKHAEQDEIDAKWLGPYGQTHSVLCRKFKSNKK